MGLEGLFICQAKSEDGLLGVYKTPNLFEQLKRLRKKDRMKAIKLEK